MQAINEHDETTENSGKKLSFENRSDILDKKIWRCVNTIGADMAHEANYVNNGLSGVLEDFKHIKLCA